MRHLEQEAVKTRQQLAENPHDAMLNVQLASLLQHLDFIQPDGGRRVPEAEAAYRHAPYAPLGPCHLKGNPWPLEPPYMHSCEQLCMHASRRAIELAPDDRVRTGVHGNLGALLISAPGRLEDALQATEQSIALGQASSMTDSRLLAGKGIPFRASPCVTIPLKLSCSRRQLLLRRVQC